MRKLAVILVLAACGPGGRNGHDPDGAGDSGPPPNKCKVQPDGDALPACTDTAPPGSFTPQVQWTWTSATEPNSIVTALVANLTDDNGDGAIDLCDTPDLRLDCSCARDLPSAAEKVRLMPRHQPRWRNWQTR